MQFRFLIKLKATEDDIFKGASALCQIHPEYVDMNLVREVQHFLECIRHSQDHGSAKLHSLTHKNRVILNYQVQSAFYNVDKILVLFLSMRGLYCTRERSFFSAEEVPSVPCA
ncbi:hypothetical protein TNCT_500101 [Trichonephila clavata]|uniref:Uncharacterized protein n=1 Tax=Trichonephila clavata TaxID=2740835 RepID=A0A8X6JL78_TRICU|nr:hypothetical protein TNCT_500101 [Trichonephila clavata]